VKRVYVEGYDTYVRFPDGVSDEEMQKALAEHYPETDDQFVARIKDPTTQAEEVSFDDYKRYRELDTGMELLDAPGVIVQAAGIAAKELYNGAKAAVKLGLQGEGGKAAASLAEGATRGTSDLTALGARIGEGVYQHLEPYFKDSGNVEIDRYHRFLALKSLDNIREAARAGDETLLEEFGLTPDMIDNDLAEGSSYFLDPSMFVGFGSGKITQLAARAASKPVRMTGAGLTKTAQGIRGVADKLSGVKASATQALDDATAGYGKYAGAGIAGAAATSLGAGPALGAAGTALLGLPALEVGGAALSAFGDAMRNTPSRIGGLRQLALDTPDTLAGKVAGQLQFLDKPIEYLGRAAGGAAVGAGVGSGIGLLAGGIEGAAQGFGAGFSSGAVGGIAGRLTEGLRGTALRRAEVNDYQNWRSRVDKPLGEYFDRYFRDHSSRIKGMDLVQLVQTAAAEKNYNVQILEPKDYDARFKNNSEGVQLIEGQQPVVYLRGVFDGKNGKDSALRVLAHEVFHTIARLDGFDVLAARIGQEAAAMYSKDEIGQFIRTYEGKLDGKRGNLTETNQNKIIEELAAEYFADLIVGKDSSYILQGDGIIASIRNMMARLIPGKLSRVIEAFESPVFGPMKQANPALRRALGDLVKARRKAYKNVMLGDGTPTRVYNETDLGNDEIYKELEALGAAYTDNKGRRQMLKPAAEKRIEKDRAQAVAAALDKVPTSTVDAEGGGLVRQPDGSYVGNRFSPSQIQAIINEPGMPNKIIEVMQVIDRAQGVVNTTYAAATAKVQRKGAKNRGKFVTRYRNLPYSNRDAALYQIVVSPSAGTMRVEGLDMSFLQAKAATNWESNPAWQQNFGNVDSMIADLKTYINALGGNTPTAQVLGSETKRNLLNKFLGVRNVRGNPLISPEYNVKEGEHPWRAFRLDRIIAMKARNEATPTRFSQRAYEQAQGNFSPYDPSYGAGERISTRTPMAVKGNVGDPIAEQLTVGIEPYRRDPVLANKAASLIKGSRILTPRQSSRSDMRVIEDYIQHGVDNLLWLHDNAPEVVRQTGKLWYDGARKIVDGWSQKYGHKPEKIAAVIAALSPGTDWFQNVDRAKRIIEFKLGKANARWTPKMNEAAERLGTSDTTKAVMKLIRNKSYSQITDPIQRAYWFRAYDEAYNAKSYPVISPDGTFGGPQKTDSGEARKIAWGDYGVIARSFQILDLPESTRTAVAENLTAPGSLSHKIRNFYNNIINPAGEFGDVTVDTHAVAAIYLKPFSQKSPEVTHNLGAGISNTRYGISGTYGINAEIYRRAAERRGLLPREMQSITWEAVRGLYSPEFKRNKKYVAKIDTVWDRFRRRTISLDEARKSITELAGGFSRPDWAERGGNDSGAGTTNDQEVLPRGDIRGRDSRGNSPGDAQRDPSQLDLKFSPARSLNNRGGAIYTNERGNRAIQLSSRSGVRVYSDRGKRIGPVFSSVEKAQDYLSRR